MNIQPYQTAWAERFQEEKKKLEQAFPGLDIHFHHIGSTAIPHCVAMPIIDILGITKDVTRVDNYKGALAQLGYVAQYAKHGRCLFQRGQSFPVHLQIFEDTHPEVERLLRFTDYMKKHPVKIQEYNRLKHQLAQELPHNRYILEKEKWIKAIDITAAHQALSPLVSPVCTLRKREWSQSEILQAMECNMLLQMTYFAKYLSNVEMICEADVTAVRSSIQDDMFNYVLCASFTEKNARERISHITSLYRKKSLPFSWWVGEHDTPKELSAHLLEAGLHFKEVNVGMYASLENVQPPSGLAFHRVHSPGQMQDFCGVIAKIGGHPQTFDLIYRQLPTVLYCGDSAIEMHIAYLNGQPIVTGILVLTAHVAGIYYVATIPEQRKKGYGTGMMKHLMARAKNKGYFLVTLQASNQGKSLYERLGFKSCCVFREYADSFHGSV